MNTQEKIGAFGALTNIVRSFTSPSPARSSAPQQQQGEDITEGAATSLPPLQVAASSGAGANGGDSNFSGSTMGLNEGDWNVGTGSGDNGFSMKYVAVAAAAGIVLWLLREKA